MSMLLVRVKGENKRNVKITNGDSFLKRLLDISSYWRGTVGVYGKEKRQLFLINV
jgi:hypothetical protein